MYKFSINARFSTVTFAVIISSLMFCGCERTESTESYTVPSHESLQTTEFLSQYNKAHPKPERMLGLVLPRGPQLWFFKLQGNMETVAAQENRVRNFLTSITFVSDDKPEWTLPPGWQQLPVENELRYATVALDCEPKLELSVTKFPSRSDLSVTEQVVMNINRWRGQLMLPPMDATDLDEQSEKLSIAGGTGYWINIFGRPQAKPAGMSQPMPRARAEGQSEPATGPSVPTFTKPAEWTQGPPVPLAVVSLQAIDGDQKATITVTRAGGDPLLNVNRWRGQLGLRPWTQDEFTSTGKVAIGTMDGDIYEITAESRSIMGVIVKDLGQSWFIKMSGDTPLVERERGRFGEFLQSLQLKN